MHLFLDRGTIFVFGDVPILQLDSGRFAGRELMLRGEKNLERIDTEVCGSGEYVGRGLGFL